MSGTSTSFIPLCVPHIGSQEWDFVRECLETHWVSYVGSYVERFENELAQVTDSEFCVALNSGTSALHLALQLLGVQPDTEVIMPAITFVAPANAVRYCHAWPTFIDIDPATWQLDTAKLRQFLDEGCERASSGKLVNRATGRKISALMAVHLLGGMADRRELARLASQFELPLIEDSAECLGTRFAGRGIAARLDDMDPEQHVVTTSFNGNKIVTTGGGGALMCHHDQLAKHAKHLSTTAKSDPIEFAHDEVGYNYRLSNVLAAIGVGQLGLLDRYVERKREIAARYAAGFANLPDVQLPPVVNEVESNYWMYTIRAGTDSHHLIRQLNNQGIQSRPLWIPMPRLPMFESCFAYRLEFTDQFYRNALSIPCSVMLSTDDQQRVVDAIEDYATESN